MGLAVPALAAHAEPHWPTLLSMQLALCAVFVSTTVWSASRWETDATLAVTSADAATPATSAADGGSDGDDGGDDDAGMTFASQMRLCYYLTLPILLSLGGVYLVLRARLVAFAQHHALGSDDKRKGDGCDDEPPATATITISTTATTAATAAPADVELVVDPAATHAGVGAAGVNADAPLRRGFSVAATAAAVQRAVRLPHVACARLFPSSLSSAAPHDETPPLSV